MTSSGTQGAGPDAETQDSSSAETPLKHVFLIDGSGFIFRAFHGLPPMTRADGTPVNAVFGYTKMLMKLLEDTDAGHVCVVFDRARKTFRSDIYPEYKANRDALPEELIPQFALVREATAALNVAMVDKDGFEADDLIATYAKKASEAGAKVTIVSSDKDMMQLVTNRVHMFDAMKNRDIGPDQVVEKFGVGPERVIDVQALAGDSADNVPGVQGIGIKTAALLINEYGDLDSVLARAGEIKQPKRRQNLLEQADMARVSRDLVTLRDDVDVEMTLNEFAVKNPDPETLISFLREQNFMTLASTMERRLGVEPAAGAPATEGGSTTGPVETKYELVQDLVSLETWVKQAESAGIVAVDTETTGLDAMQVDLVGISLCIVPGHACYIPLAHKAPAAQATLDLLGDANNAAEEELTQIPMADALACLKPMLENPGVLKVGQNIKYDMKIFERNGISVNTVDDTMLLSFVLEGGLHGHGMDELAREFLHIDTIKFSDVAGKGKAQVTFDYVPLDKAVDYAAEDADITLRLYHLFKPRLAQEQMVGVYETLERPLIPILRKIEATGIRADAAKLKALSDDFAVRLTVLEAELHTLAEREFNIASPKQLGEILFDEMAIPGGKKTKTGAWQTGAEVLEKLADQGHELPVKILAARQLAKLKSTYTDALQLQINPQTGRVHTSYNQSGAATGRMSSHDPNLQNIPIRSEEGRKIRQAFVAKDGHKLLAADYSQIELRLLAHVADIGALKQAFKNGDDIHAMTASQVFGVPVEGMDPMVRRNAKAINFGIIYGISAFGLAKQLGISRSEAAQYIDSYFEKYPGIRSYMERTKEEARRGGFVTTLFGRKFHVRGINDKNQNVKNLAERAAINAPIQGGAADIIKRAMTRLPQALLDAGLSSKILLQVHDELVLEVPDDEIDKTKQVVTDIMQNAAHLDVPLIVDIGIGDNWDEAH